MFNDIRHWLLEPHYGFERNGVLAVPSTSQIFREIGRRLNIFKSPKTWLVPWQVFVMLFFGTWTVIYAFQEKHWSHLLIVVVFGFFFQNTHSTTFIHRLGGHRSFKIRNRIWTFVAQNLMIKIVPEEIFVPSHYVHHKFSDLPGDPHNPKGGWLYCFFSDMLHQLIAPDLVETEYERVSLLMSHFPICRNSYAQYQRYGTISHPAGLIGSFLFNWVLWASVLYIVGGWALASIFFASAFIWLVSIRNFNYKAHGGGVDRRTAGYDLSSRDLSLNRPLPGYTAGEWHANHHVFPQSARNDFFPWQTDTSWMLIRSLYAVGIVTEYNDQKSEFIAKYLHAPVELIATKASHARPRQMEASI